MFELGGLYVHIPFCKRKCPYCDFFSVLPGNLVPGFLRDLEREVELRAGHWRGFDTLYVGGGTPSLLTPAQIADLMGSVRRLFGVACGPEVEVTMELNPADVGGELLAALGDAGVNRLSLGVQSFADEELELLGRRHRRAGAVRAIERIRAAGFASLGLDLIYGIPGSSRGRWRESLDAALGFSPDHLSLYALTIADGTPYQQRVAAGELALPGESEIALLFLDAAEILGEAGYDHYEVSNYARTPELRSRHNQKYWSRLPTLGLGPAAHSFDGRRRWANWRSLDAYHRTLVAGQEPVAEVEEIDAEMARLERIALGMRTARGVALEDGRERPEAEGAIARLLREGYVTEAGGRLRPTRRGFLVADGMAKLLC